MKHLLRAAWVLTSVFAATCLSSSQGQAAVANAFKTPSGNIACAEYEGYLRCDLAVNTAVKPARPKDCQLDWGNAFEMQYKGQAKRICHGDTVFGKYPTLAYGKTWKHLSFTCVSESKGLTCTNQDKHGWFINKVEQKFF